MWEFIIVALISCLMGMGVGGESASLTEGGGPLLQAQKTYELLVVVEGVL